MSSNLKRAFSETSSDASSHRPTKLSRLSKTLVNIWELGEDMITRLRGRKIETNTGLKQYSPSTEPLSLSSRSNVIQSPIKASRLAEYYEKVKLENSKLVSQLQKQKNDTLNSETGTSSAVRSNITNEFQPAESTQLDGSNISNADSKTFDAALSSAKVSSDSKAKLDGTAVIKAPLYSHRLTFGIDPAERAQFIQLKRRIQADRYQRTRHKYLQSHTQHLVHASSTISSINPHYVNTSVNTIDKDSAFEQKVPSNALGTIDSIPKSKRNTRGIFTLQMAYNIPSDDESDADSELSLPQAKPVASKLKFLASGRKSKFSIGEKKKPLTKTVSVDKDSNEQKNKKHTDSVALKPTAAFTFGSHKQTPKLAFVSSEMEEKHASSALSTSGSKETSISSVPSAKTSLFSSTKSSEAKKSVPAFSFTKKTENDIESATTTKPAFSFSPSVNNAKEKIPVKPAFSLAPKNNKKEGESMPAFSFETKKDTASAPAFSFGGKNTDKTEKPSHSENAPTFNFAAKSETSLSNDSKHGFSFAKDTHTNSNENDKPAAFSFSSKKQPQTNKDIEKKSTVSAFKFGQPATSSTVPSKPAFSFNSPAKQKMKVENKTTNELPKGPSQKDETQSSSTTVFSFGHAEPQKVTESKSTITTAAAATTASSSSSSVPAFNFSSNAKPLNNSSASSGFSFKPPKQAAAANSTSITPAFSFNAKAQNVTGSKAPDSKPAFSFNTPAKSDSTKVETNSNGFSEPQDRKRVRNSSAAPAVFNMDASKISSAASSSNLTGKSTSGNGSSTRGFTFGGSQASTGFGSASSPAFSAPKAPGSVQATFATKNSTSNNDTNTSKTPAFTFGGKSSIGNDPARNGSVPPSFGSSQNNSGLSASSGFSSGFNFKQPSGFNTTANGFGQRSNSNPPQGTAFKSNTNNTSSVFGQNSKGGSGFGGFGTNAGNQQGQNAFGAGNNNNGNNTFGGNNNDNNSSGSGMFNLNNNAFPSLPPSHIQQSQQAQPQQNSQQNGFGGFNGQGFGASQNNPNPSFNFNMSSTPNFNFAGNNANKDPSAIFSGPPVQPMPRRARRKLAPHPLRRH